MDRLYQKSEIGFSIAWIIVYIAGSSIADIASDGIGVTKVVTAVFHLGLSTLAYVWVCKKNLRREYGLCKGPVGAAKFLYYIPLMIIASCNLWYGVALNLTIVESVLYIVSMICVGFLFVIIFHRGGSLLPCILVHSTINGLSVFADESKITNKNEIVTTILLIVVSVMYIWVLLKTLPETKEEK